MGFGIGFKRLFGMLFLHAAKWGSLQKGRCRPLPCGDAWLPVRRFPVVALFIVALCYSFSASAAPAAVDCGWDIPYEDPEAACQAFVTTCATLEDIGPRFYPPETVKVDSGMVLVNCTILYDFTNGNGICNSAYKPPPFTQIHASSCVYTCPVPQVLDLQNGECNCPPGQEFDSAGKCIPKCLPGEVRNSDGICELPPCPPGQVRNSAGVCEFPPCPPGQARNGAGICEPKPCPPGQERNSAGECALPPCPDGLVRDASGQCGCPPGKKSVDGVCTADPNSKDKPDPCDKNVGDPVNPKTGNEFQIETDYAGAGAFPLVFTRIYNSASANRQSFNMASNWTGPFGRAIVAYGGDSPSFAAVVRPEGQVYQFRLQDGSWRPDADITDTLDSSRKQLFDIRNGTATSSADADNPGWTYRVAADDSTEQYDGQGRLLRITARNGLNHNYSLSDGNGDVLYRTQPGPDGYLAPACVNRPAGFAMPARAGLMLCITDYYGRQLNFAYDTQNRISQMMDPAGGLYGYAYDTANNLTAVSYPDGKTRQYTYNESALTSGSNLPHALTGITDENGKRFATIAYDAQGRAIATQHANGVEAVAISYGNNATTVVDALNATRTYHYQTLLGRARDTSQSQPGGSGCSAAASAITYDANGNVASSTNFNGVTTTYLYDLSRNLETSRTEAAGTPQARTITTEWHPAYTLPTAIAQPLRRTTLGYDYRGNLLTTSVQASSDATGAQGFAAAGTGAARTTSYSYNEAGQVLSITGPRTDVTDVTTFTWDAMGNLSSVTNALGQVTTLSNYDPHGRAGRIVDANGLTTDMTYSPRGWLTSRNVGGQRTVYEYDGAGQLQKTTLPDGATLSYTLDDAHRLTRITDSLGNSISYTLDAMGNRLTEQVRDPGGTLAQQITRIFDTLNRLQQITGGLQ